MFLDETSVADSPEEATPEAPVVEDTVEDSEEEVAE